jgi:hypothetical protein
MNKLTDSQYAAIHLAYMCLWENYLKAKRCRSYDSPEHKEWALKPYRGRLTGMQEIMVDILGIDDIAFKPF